MGKLREGGISDFMPSPASYAIDSNSVIRYLKESVSSPFRVLRAVHIAYKPISILNTTVANDMFISWSALHENLTY